MHSKNLYDPNQMAYGRGSNTTRSYRVTKPTLKLKTVALSRRRVRHTHTNFTPHEACNKRTKSSMIEPACNGKKVTRTILPRWRMTMSPQKDEITGRSNCSAFAIVLPPTPCQRVTRDLKIPGRGATTGTAL